MSYIFFIVLGLIFNVAFYKYFWDGRQKKQLLIIALLTVLGVYVVTALRGFALPVIQNMSGSFKVKTFALSLIIGMLYLWMYHLIFFVRSVRRLKNRINTGTEATEKWGYETERNNLICFGTLIVVTWIQISLMFDSNVWTDEATRIVWARDHSWSELMEIIIEVDVSPPLFLLALKALFFVFGYSLAIAKLYAFFCVFLMHVIVVFAARMTKYYKESMGCGALTSLVLIAMTCTPVFLYLTTEIGQYGVAALFTFSTGIVAIYIMLAPSWKKAIVFAVTFLLASYSHYWALATCTLIAFGVAFFLLIKSSSYLKLVVASAVMIILGYLPWIPAFLHQTRRVNGDNWWMKFTFKSTEAFLAYPIGFNYQIEIAVLTVLIIVVIYQYRNKQKNVLYYVGIVYSLLVYIVLVLGETLSAINRPVLVMRYLALPTTTLWIGIALLIYLVQPRIPFYSGILALVICVFIKNYPIALYDAYETGTSDTITFINNNCSPNDTLSSNILDFQSGTVFQYYFPNYKYGKVDWDKMSAGEVVWFFENTKNTVDDSFFISKGLDVTTVFSGNIDNRIFFNIKKIVNSE